MFICAGTGTGAIQICYTVLMSPKKDETDVHGCNQSFNECARPRPRAINHREWLVVCYELEWDVIDVRAELFASPYEFERLFLFCEYLVSVLVRLA